MTLTGFSNNIALTAENPRQSETIKSFSKAAFTYNVAIVFGLTIRDGIKSLNSLVFIDSDGKILTKYSKIHPFTFAGEDQYFNAGSKLGIAKFLGVKIGLTICYDLRFPELYSSLARKCDMIINIANWPSNRIDHWNTLLKARAIENQVFVAGVNRIGVDGNGLEYVDSSNIFNGNGEKLQFSKEDDMQLYEIDTNWSKIFKEKFNTTVDRKVKLYKEIL